ncbi:MAG: prepilin-type N-terminal cleavage/methylation domain-containing protein [Candidatus Omnitrophica bacterium]|nr:prepilin-type N-terminal cleavage/methylation domain-containing protein [Candidatus Omnitrophota bacterium]
MKKQNNAFTFIELLIALSIFAVVAVTLYSTFFAGLSVWKRSGDGSDVYQDIRTVFDDMARDFRNMIYFTKDKESMYIFSGMPKEIILMTLEEGASEKMEPYREVVKVTYSFDDTKGELIRQRAALAFGFDLKKAEKEVLLKDLGDFKFEYCYYSGDEDEPYLWQEEWKDEDEKTPRGIRITAVLKNGKGGEEMSKITRVIFIPTGILGKKEI